MTADKPNFGQLLVKTIRALFRPEGPVQLSAPGNAWGYEIIPFVRPERATQFSTEDREAGKLHCPYRAKATRDTYPGRCPGLKAALALRAENAHKNGTLLSSPAYLSPSCSWG